MSVFPNAGFPPCALWDFALKLYSNPTVEQACLSLQNRKGVDVNLLLFCVWVAASGREELREVELEEGMAISHYWQEATVRPMRNIRNFLKPPLKYVDNRLTNELKRVVSESEIYAEKLQLLALDRLIDRPATASFSGSICARAAVQNLFKYLAKELDAEPDDQDRADIKAIWLAVFSEEDELFDEIA
ncbi:TIGR02444 family protein [Sneathiella aquimaris]|uniref:TIGR02444 family protein n=1 Tax=Sneathiella aquimaris TaxID=2599305 RepID=UPI00146F6680|nr:TIGR02444 family protein [Sneathiella aquimaris]